MIPIFMPSYEDLALLALSIIACGVLMIAFWISYDWIEEMRDLAQGNDDDRANR